MKIIIEQVLILFIFGAVGFMLAKLGIVKKEHSGVLSKLLVYVFLPANIVKTFAKNFTVGYLRANYLIVLVSLAIILLLCAVMHFTAKLFSRDGGERGIYEYSLIIPNFGYMGYAFAEALFGGSGLMDAMMLAIPMSVYTYTIGFCLLSGKRMSFKSLINPTMITLLVGMLIGITGLGGIMPDFAYNLLDKASVCMAPVSMLLAGIVISEFGIRRMLADARVYIITALRLFIVPMAIGGVLTLLSVQSYIIAAAVVLYAMPCGLNTIVFVRNAGGNCEIGAGLAFVSNIVAIVSIPVVLMIFGISL